MIIMRLKMAFKGCLKVISITVPFIVFTDCIAYVAKVEGISMRPTFNDSGQTNSDFVLLSQWLARNYHFKRGQIVSIISPRDPNQLIIKRVIALEGDTVQTRPTYKERHVMVPRGHCWVEGDNHAKSLDSNTFGPVPLGLISATSMYIIWPPNRWKKLDIKLPSDRTSITYPNNSYYININKNYGDISSDESISLVEPF